MNEQEILDAVKLIDKILTSENKNIKDAWRELLIIVALSESPAEEDGPLTALVREINLLRNEVAILRGSVARDNTWKDNNSGGGTITTPWTAPYPTSFPYTSGGSITGINDTNITWTSNSYINEILGDTWVAEDDGGKGTLN